MVQATDWKQLLEEVSAETDTATLRNKADDMEAAIFLRFQDLATSPDGDEERNALNRACALLFRIRVEKLDYPHDSRQFAIGFCAEVEERVDR